MFARQYCNIVQSVGHHMVPSTITQCPNQGIESTLGLIGCTLTQCPSQGIESTLEPSVQPCNLCMPLTSRWPKPKPPIAAHPLC